MKSKAQMVVTVVVFALAILSIAAGIPKIIQMPQELAFLGAIGIPGIGVSILGVAQVSGGIILPIKKIRLAGAIIVALMFLISSIAIFVGGNVKFGVVSLLPVVVAIAVICSPLMQTRQTN